MIRATTRMTEAEMKLLFDSAMSHGREAAKNARLQMMQVRDGKTGEVYAPFPICGMAWVTIRPGTGRFARWLKKTGRAGPGCDPGGTGVSIWIGEHQQSFDMKDAHGRAMVEFLRERGIKATLGSRLD